MNTCLHDPMEMCGKPIGMYHCPLCGEMVIACSPHPDYSPEGQAATDASYEEYMAKQDKKKDGENPLLG